MSRQRIPLYLSVCCRWPQQYSAYCGVASSRALPSGFSLSPAACWWQDLPCRSASLTGDLLMLAAVLVCGLGYAEGAALSRKLGGWQVICWALLLSLPAMLVLSLLTMPASFAGIGTPAWAGLAYVSLFSMLIGFVFWYRGLAQGGIAAVGQLQLLQPFFGLALAATLLHEPVSMLMVGVTVAVIACVAGSKRFA